MSKSKKYSFSDYNKYVVLKPGMAIWFIIIYFMRPFILLISTIQMGRGMKNENVSVLKDMIYPDDFGLFIGILAALPVSLVIYAYMKRKPGASDSIKKLWRNGANILSFVAILNIMTLFVPYARGIIGYISITDWVQFVIAVFIIIFLNTSQRVKDSFADFPQ